MTRPPSVTMYVGVRSAQACMTANGFSRVSKQHSHPLLFPFLPSCRLRPAISVRTSISKSIHLKQLATLTTTVKTPA